MVLALCYPSINDTKLIILIVNYYKRFNLKNIKHVSLYKEENSYY